LKKKTVGLLVGMSFVLGVASVSAAGPVIKNISAKINYGITLKLNGQSFVPKDPNGKELRPITFEGSNYVPLRAIAEALDVPVNYDPKTLEISLGEKDKAQDLVTSKLYYESDNSTYPSIDPGMLTVQGKTYKSGYVVLFEHKYSSRSFSLKTNNNFANIEFDIAVADKDHSYTVKVFDAKRTIIREALVDDKETVHIKAPVGGLERVYIEVIPEKGEFEGKAKVIIGEITGK